MVVPIEQGLPNSFLEPPQHCTFCLLYQSHLFQLISSLVATPRPEMGVSDKGDMQNVQCWGGSRIVFGNPCYRTNFSLGPFSWLHSHRQQELWSGRQRCIYSLHLQMSAISEWRTLWSELFLLRVLGFVIAEMERKHSIYMIERARKSD